MKPPEEVQRGLVQQWIAKAAQDMDAAVFLLTQGDRFRGAIGFHSQQAAEKYLKALLEELGLSVEKTHELEDLLDQLLPHHLSLRSLRRGLAFLSQFAVEVRYPGDNASKRQATSALRWAGKVRHACRGLLSLRGGKSP